MNRAAWGCLVLAAVLGLSSCRFDGINEMALPGGTGTGDNAIEVTVELPDVGTLTPNAQVKVGDIAVGTVREINVADWHAEAVLSIEPDVDLPANASASVGVNTLLGAAYVELAAPDHPRGELADGARIPLERGHAYPSTEQVLSAASLALNGGGLEQISTITAELNRVLGGNDRAVGDLLPRLEGFVSALNDQRAEILAAVGDVATMSERFAGQRRVITRALDEIGPALETLSTERPNITGALRSLTDLAHVVVPLVTDIRDDLVSDLENLDPVIRALVRAGDSTVSALGFAVTFPFAPETVTNACRGDYCNLTAIFDLTNTALATGFINPDGTLGIPGFPGLDLAGLVGLLGGNGTVGGVPGLINGLTAGQNPGGPVGRQPDLSLDGLLGGLTGGN
ncbi:MCE family protein [Nocardioides immobilis]|uniref:MCE family protein n=1 Tax=Nocardioides immobilis TaxID=2049295 RepID=A0A417XSB9_9ACTN|nr:MCE family protein [Nocardioides immobilis]RHW22831.1 MCE family protein [Nocardioides immobilis]